MSIAREFLDWRRPALSSAAEFLLGRHRAPAVFDLGAVLVVVPGSRAGRRLLELLVEQADREGLAFIPPQIITESRLPEELYTPQRPFASELTLRCAWVAALRQMPASRLRPLLPHPPEPADTPRWLQLGSLLGKLHEELAADALNFRDALAKADFVSGFAEHERWNTLAELQQAYLNLLDGLQLWDIQTARLVAIEKREIQIDRQIVLIGTVDLNRAQRQMLDQVAERVTALIFAPSDLADRFDSYGCLQASAWTSAEAPLRDEQIQRVDGPADQAAAVGEWLQSLNGTLRADQIVIGLPDESLAPQIQRQLAQSSIATRWVEGRHLSETGPYRLLEQAVEYAVRRRFVDLAALVRHPDLYDWLLGKLRSAGDPSPDLLTALDKFAGERFPARFDEDRLKSEADLKPVFDIHTAIDELLKPLSSSPRPLAEWVAPLRQLLIDVYGAKELDRNQPQGRYLYEALTQIAAAIDELGEVPAAIQPAVDAREAARMVLEALSGKSIPPPADPAAIELLGWLELPLDDAPALIVTTFNDGFVPGASHGELFLPNGLRQALGVLDNDRRLARDAYALSALLASRDNVRLVVGQRDADDNPLIPSRLLFAADTDTVVRRSLQFFSDAKPSAPRRNLLLPAGGALQSSTLVPPRPMPLEQPVDRLRVTQFRDYIACPYRFYLRHLLKLLAISDSADELDGGAFGGLVHLVLEQYGRTDEAADARQATDPAHVLEYLDHKLKQIAAARFGVHSRSAIRVQIEQIRLRLSAFAKWQAQRTREGWRIVHGEDSDRTLAAEFPVDGVSFSLGGRIDRIDYHDGLKRLCVLDYKTADEGRKPEQTHRRHKTEWTDLQLPLYRHLLSSAALPADVSASATIELGYILLPKSPDGFSMALAEWTADDLNAADERAREIIRAVRAGVFWPPTTPPPDFADDVAVLCQDNRLGSWRQVTEGDAA